MKPSMLRRMWNTICGRNPATNANGTITTKFGDRIIPYQVTVRGNGLSSNVSAFISQPRVRQFMREMEPFLHSPYGDKIISDDTAGEFFLQSDLNKNGREKATVLGTFDPDVEEGLVKQAAQLMGLRKMFGDASANNPIVMDPDGTVYPKNNPADVRGKVNLSRAICNPGTGRRGH